MKTQHALRDGAKERPFRMGSGISLPVTCNLIIADRSESGTVAVASILEICPLAGGQISAWRNSTDDFFVFIAEHSSGVIGSVTAVSLEQLLEGVLPELFAQRLKPPAIPEFDIFVEDFVAPTIHDCVVRLQIAAAFDEGNRR